MPAPENRLKTALNEGRMQIGLWLNSGSALVSEIAGATGFDWCLIDAEHAPYDPVGIADQLRALALGGTSAVVRVPVGEDWVIKQVLDLGAQTILVPMVDTAAQAGQVVRATRYAPEGVRGLGASVARVSGFGRTADYPTTANGQIGVIVQAETRRAIDNLDDILAVEGVDCVFIGPADLSADMGYPGNPGADEVVATIAGAVRRIRAAGKAAGIIHYDPGNFGYYADLGITFLGVGADVSLMRTSFAETLDTARRASGQ
ncbi:HpcH/HpaI aldolase family protein [Sinisalibacter aestuarii]|uniref:2-keto-3-deoxy-L-rhamnonate aldolase n=1 Tax=Sinisalibacter aestuarii TaxID=2949426 RepID=A0ABQ5LTC2_9RHOB|nr:HpcH/HpaI aldolase/citrate lyase family protein [Sinisalibacter aestuarii]GKY88003.1 2-keto-3-deoxy-L-rhamnonate aldolase [Sinisalibacter aestuarii]